MAAQRRPKDDLDSPWKDALELFLERCLQLLFPQVHDGIDWQRGYDSLDKEFQQIVRDAPTGAASRTNCFASGSRTAAKSGC